MNDADFSNIVVLSDIPNGAVIQLTGRRFPGVLLQGDSLKNLVDLCAELERRLSESEEKCLAEEIHAILANYLIHYEHVLAAAEIDLPYPKRVAQ